MASLFNHGQRIEELGLGEEVVEPVLIEGEESGGVGELVGANNMSTWRG
jgi:hypothetical protein